MSAIRGTHEHECDVTSSQSKALVCLAGDASRDRDQLLYTELSSWDSQNPCSRKQMPRVLISYIFHHNSLHLLTSECIFFESKIVTKNIKEHKIVRILKLLFIFNNYKFMNMLLKNVYIYFTASY